MLGEHPSCNDKNQPQDKNYLDPNSGTTFLNFLTDRDFCMQETTRIQEDKKESNPEDPDWFKYLQLLVNAGSSIFLVSERNNLMKAALLELLDQEKFFEIKNFLEYLQYVIIIIFSITRISLLLLKPYINWSTSI